MYVFEALDATSRVASLKGQSSLPLWGLGPVSPPSLALHSFSNQPVKGQVGGKYDGVLESDSA